jgi:hypothetical protein
MLLSFRSLPIALRLYVRNCGAVVVDTLQPPGELVGLLKANWHNRETGFFSVISTMLEKHSYIILFISLLTPLRSFHIFNVLRSCCESVFPQPHHLMLA